MRRFSASNISQALSLLWANYILLHVIDIIVIFGEKSNIFTVVMKDNFVREYGTHQNLDSQQFCFYPVIMEVFSKGLQAPCPSKRVLLSFQASWQPMIGSKEPHQQGWLKEGCPVPMNLTWFA